jgi:hypothetical protein
MEPGGTERRAIRQQPHPTLLWAQHRGPARHCVHQLETTIFFLKVEEDGLLHGLGHTVGRGRVSTWPIFCHLQGTD